MALHAHTMNKVLDTLTRLRESSRGNVHPLEIDGMMRCTRALLVMAQQDINEDLWQAEGRLPKSEAKVSD